MWVIFRDPLTAFNHLDKYIVDMVADEDIQTYQDTLANTVKGRTYEFYTNVFFIQPFFTSDQDIEYFVRRYNTWMPLS